MNPCCCRSWKMYPSSSASASMRATGMPTLQLAAHVKAEFQRCRPRALSGALRFSGRSRREVAEGAPAPEPESWWVLAITIWLLSRSKRCWSALIFWAGIRAGWTRAPPRQPSGHSSTVDDRRWGRYPRSAGSRAPRRAPVFVLPWQKSVKEFISGRLRQDHKTAMCFCECCLSLFSFQRRGRNE